MENMMIVTLASAIIGAGMLWGVNTKQFKTKGNFRNFVMIAGIVALAWGSVGSLYHGGMVTDLGGAEGMFLTATGVAPSVQPTVLTTTVTPGVKQRPISTLSVISTVKNSNSHTDVSGYLRIFDPDTNPSDPTASNLDSVTLSSGVGSTTNKYVRTSTPYRVVFDGDGTYYDKDYGIMTFDDEDFNPSTGEYLFDMKDITLVATISDMINESALSGDVNGQTSSSAVGTAELGSAGTDTFTYDVSIGDGQFYFKPTLEASTAYSELKNAVLCFEWDTSNAPEGNEISSITASLVSGTDLGIPAELVNYWSNEECVSLGDMTAGQSSQIKLLFTVDDTAIDANDGYFLAFDDLGSLRGKDLNLDTGATIDRITFEHQA